MRQLLLRALFLLPSALCLMPSAAFAAITEYYVTVTGGATKTGTQEDPFDWATFTARMAGGAAAAGDRYNIQEGAYSVGATDTWTNDGSATSPIVLRGCLTDWTPITPTRTSGTGALVTTHYPAITYSSSYLLNASGSDNVIFSALSITTTTRGGASFMVGTDALVFGCKVSNPYNNSAAAGIQLGGAASSAVLCDADCAGAASSAAIYCASSANRVVACRITDSGGQGVKLSGTVAVVVGNVISGCTEYGVYFNYGSSTSAIIGNTIYGTLGIGLSNDAYTQASLIVGNHVTDGSAYGIVHLHASGCPVLLAYNRTRDNVTAAISWAGDWATATTWSHVTTDSGGAETDYVSAPSDLRLIPAAPGKATGLFASDVGALQRADPLLPSVSDVWYGVTGWGEGGTAVGTKRASSITNCEAAYIADGVTIDDVLGELVGGLTAQETVDALKLAPSGNTPNPTDFVTTQQQLVDALKLAPTPP